MPILNEHDRLESRENHSKAGKDESDGGGQCQTGATDEGCREPTGRLETDESMPGVEQGATM
jgi:hypothetical protein